MRLIFHTKNNDSYGWSQKVSLNYRFEFLMLIFCKWIKNLKRINFDGFFWSRSWLPTRILFPMSTRQMLNLRLPLDNDEIVFHYLMITKDAFWRNFAWKVPYSWEHTIMISCGIFRSVVWFSLIHQPIPYVMVIELSS